MDLAADFVGRHLIVDATTYNRRNLTSTDTVFSLFESLARNLDMTLIIPPIVCRYPFANSELENFCHTVERDLEGQVPQPDLASIRTMRQFLAKRQVEDSGVTGISVWAESHCAIHTWDADNYFAFDAFSCKDYAPKDALRLLLNHFDVEVLNCINLIRRQRSGPTLSNFQVNTNWDVLVQGVKIGELETVDFDRMVAQ
jgi:S-adenosylmethionine decarboxylase